MTLDFDGLQEEHNTFKPKKLLNGRSRLTLAVAV